MWCLQLSPRLRQIANRSTAFQDWLYSVLSEMLGAKCNVIIKLKPQTASWVTRICGTPFDTPVLSNSLPQLIQACTGVHKELCHHRRLAFLTSPRLVATSGRGGFISGIFDATLASPVYLSSHWHLPPRNRTANLLITSLAHQAVAEVSNHNEPIGRKCGIQLVRRAIRFRFNSSELQLIWISV